MFDVDSPWQSCSRTSGQIKEVRTDSGEILLTGNESRYGQVRKKLSHLQMNSKSTTCAVRSGETLADTLAKMRRHINGLCNRTALVKLIQCNTHGCQQTDKNETSNSMQKRYRHTRVGQTIYLTHMLSTWFTPDTYLRLRTTVRIWAWELHLRATGNRTKAVNHIPTQKNGQMKMINGVMKQYFWGYVNYLQDGWED